MAHRVDFRTRFKSEYAASRKPALRTIRPGRYLSIKGEGAAESPAFQDAVDAILSVASTVRAAQKAQGHDFTIAPLEGMWTTTPPAAWTWQLLIRVPSTVGANDVRRAVKTLLARGTTSAAVTRVGVANLHEGRSVQMLHVGPYADEMTTIDMMRAFAAEHGLRVEGPHHEIYLSNPSRVAPEKLRTIVRYHVTAR